MSRTVYITDHIFPDVETERSILDEIDATVTDLDASTAEDVIERAADANGLIVNKAPINETVLDGLPQLQVVARYGSGFENVDIEAATRNDVAVTNVPEYCVDEVATHTLSLVLASQRRLFPYGSQVKNGGWDWRAQSDITRFADQTMGIIGFGSVGRAVTELLRDWGVDVVVYSRSASREEVDEYGAQKVSFEELLGTADVVTLHTALTGDTHHLIDADALTTMQDDATLVNTARGELIDQDALYEALTSDEIAFAALDVLEEEPPNVDEPLVDLDSVFVTPHVAWYSGTAIDVLQETVAKEVARALQGEPPENLLNPAVFE